MLGLATVPLEPEAGEAGVGERQQPVLVAREPQRAQGERLHDRAGRKQLLCLLLDAASVAQRDQCVEPRRKDSRAPDKHALERERRQ